MTNISLRDYFAAKAMQALIACGHTDYDLVAEWAYKYADAMLKEKGISNGIQTTEKHNSTNDEKS